MTTFNGEKYLSEQIESIVSQTFENWTLLIRDDGSIDDTLSIIKKYLALDKRLELLIDDKGSSGSAANNFNLLCLEALKRGYDYYFFSDQDDVWVKDKVNIFLNQMIDFEGDKKPQPVLMYSDLFVVDENNTTIHNSFMDYQSFKNEQKEPLKTLLVQNYVTGCAVLVNQHLLSLACPFPKEIIMHDWWLALCTSAVGKIHYINKPLVSYRQHSSNTVGAAGFWSIINPFDYGFISHWAENKEGFKATIRQAGELHKRLLDANNYDVSKALKLTEIYSTLLSHNAYKPLMNVISCGLKRQGFVPYFMFLGRLAFMPKNNELE